MLNGRIFCRGKNNIITDGDVGQYYDYHEHCIIIINYCIHCHDCCYTAALAIGGPAADGGILTAAAIGLLSCLKM